MAQFSVNISKYYYFDRPLPAAYSKARDLTVSLDKLKNHFLIVMSHILG